MLEGLFIVNIGVTKDGGGRIWNREEGCKPKSPINEGA